jgi:membrane protease YdiL (CAAX protease family)
MVAPCGAWLAHAVFGLQVRTQTWPYWLWLLVAAPLVEETVFRPLLQQGLHQRLLGAGLHIGRVRQEPWAGHLANSITAIAFAAVHAPSHGWLAVLWLAPGLALGEIWRRGQSLWVCVALHSWFNLCLAVASK